MKMKIFTTKTQTSIHLFQNKIWIYFLYFDFYTLSTYSPFSVFTEIVSPSAINIGTFKVAPFSRVIIFIPPFEVSPRTAGGASFTLKFILIGKVTFIIFSSFSSSVQTTASTFEFCFKNFADASPISITSNLNLLLLSVGSQNQYSPLL